MRAVKAGTIVMALWAAPVMAQSYNAPAPTDVPPSGIAGLSKAERKRVCTLVADDRHMTGLIRQQYRAACRGRPIPQSL